MEITFRFFFGHFLRHFLVLLGYFAGPGDPEVRRYIFALGQAAVSNLAKKMCK